MCSIAEDIETVTTEEFFWVAVIFILSPILSITYRSETVKSQQSTLVTVMKEDGSNKQYQSFN